MPATSTPNSPAGTRHAATPAATAASPADTHDGATGETDAAPIFDDDELKADDNDNYSDLASSIGDPSEFMSITSYVRKGVYENGRRYHALEAGRYTLPNDEQEQERLDMYHSALRLLLGDGTIHLATLPENPQTILDCGTGTGCWAIDMAEQHPQAQVFGVDLSPIQPGWVPPNCVFEVDDLEKDWIWRERFDFVHSANMSQSIRDWPRYIKNIYDFTNPGGAVEFAELRTRWLSDDNSIPAGGAIEEYQRKYDEAVEILGLTDISPELERLVRNAGFENVRVIIKKLPLGLWPKERKKREVGWWGMKIMEIGCKSYAIAPFTRALNMSVEEAETLSDRAKEEGMNPKVHAYIQLWFVVGNKPAA